MATAKLQLNKNEKEVVIKHKGMQLEGLLGVPEKSKGLIIFAHGSGSSRWSTRNNFVARELQKKGFSTLLMDLLTPTEEMDRANVFDIRSLAQRLLWAKDWSESQPGLKGLPIAYFGASTGAGAALVAAADEPDDIFAVVSRGGRPDMAESDLGSVKAPTLLIVGGDDTVVIGLNQRAYKQLMCKKDLSIIPGASHLFEEPGALEHVAKFATDWFIENLPAKTSTLSPQERSL